MTAKEQRRTQVLTRVLSGAITLREAALVLGVCLRQARRLKAAFEARGPSALVHGNRGRPSPRQLASAVQAQVVALYQGRYAGCNHQHFTELLAEREDLELSVATVRRTLKRAGCPSPQHRRAVKHRSRRERMAQEGLLLQIDGSPYRWLGPEGPRWCLISGVDDATGAPEGAVFREQEDAAGYLLLLRQVVERKGIPAAVYRDRHGIFQSPVTGRRSLDEELAGVLFPTQFGRLLAELGVTSIAAGSPQAKGRVERPWRTHQDRLVAELRLAGVTTIEGANAFLPGYLARYRARFAVPPTSPATAYVPVGPEVALDRLFCFKYTRKVTPDNTIQFGSRVLQIPPGPDRLSYARTTVEVQEHLDARLTVSYQGRCLLTVGGDPTAPLRARPRRTHLETGAAPQPQQSGGGQVGSGPPLSILSTAPAAPPRPPKPGPNHPWRRKQADRITDGYSGQIH